MLNLIADDESGDAVSVSLLPNFLFPQELGAALAKPGLPVLAHGLFVIDFAPDLLRQASAALVGGQCQQAAHRTSVLEQQGTRVTAATTVRQVVLAGLLGLTSGCELLLGIRNLGDPDMAVMHLSDEFLSRLVRQYRQV